MNPRIGISGAIVVLGALILFWLIWSPARNHDVTTPASPDLMQKIGR
jgi:hypothetical protein